ncbi:ABC transporter substrate-binding protein [Curtobacterium sp. C1]|uniref:ABC transporter substrate-binding protein n=1 Tax=Curtobacterium citreum TaxID=2036 RepID=A0ABT2HJI4_9MICO|nr:MULTISPECIES: ABC transporter substrate-binding protein [Curtobacterium]MCS5488683.1 ABC transporter substrate-binding protein [Curtobacterium flaccumfaciens pv. basellae]MCS6523438.1 ABC transporter substrate-binding protein [Curtobacterium citreum]MDK8172480.1 ABC transporter substrate-binding protein [Curtobacterium citreum]QKS14098.1 ABC transporter substrate-binding protein [Curtobacterium sp. csp3]QKS21182.1 ABC transporter substrate-binding protein [Curtobacterium sp. Csp1]
MITAKIRAGVAAALALGVAAALTGCASSNPLDSGSSASSDSKTIVIGSQQYYSNEIIAEMYAQVLEKDGFTVKRNFNIGQREIYIPQLEKGAIDVMPEYSGNLLQYFDKESTAKTASQIDEGLSKALPSGLRVLDAAEATDQDSYTVTKEFSEKNDVTSLADLKNVSEKLTVGANSEFQTRPYGPDGLKSVYGVDVDFKAIEDSGGALTVKALKDGTVQLADIYTADPSIKANDLVSLKDPENLILPQNVIPVVSKKVDDKAAADIDKVNKVLTEAALIEVNSKSTVDKEKASQIAKDFLSSKGLL